MKEDDMHMTIESLLIVLILRLGGEVRIDSSNDKDIDFDKEYRLEFVPGDNTTSFLLRVATKPASEESRGY